VADVLEYSSFRIGREQNLPKPKKEKKKKYESGLHWCLIPSGNSQAYMDNFSSAFSWYQTKGKL